jgi:excisionase family DNA binding protein
VSVLASRSRVRKAEGGLTMSELLTPAEACERLGIRRRLTLRDWERNGRLTAVRLRYHDIRYKADEIERLLETSYVGRWPQQTIEQRFLAKVDKTDTCWLWTGALRNGYGRIRGRGRGSPNIPVHRFAYELLVGPIPDGLVIDHLCRVRNCVNPAHLEPVTSRVNGLRSVPFNWESAKTHCAQGHAYDEANTRWNARGGRGCRACDRARRAARSGAA